MACRPSARPFQSNAHATAELTGIPAPPVTLEMPSPVAGGSLCEYRLGWVRAAVVDAAVPPGLAEAQVCQCEEVTARDILEVRPPRYLDWQGSPRNSADLATLLGNGAPNPDQVKRLTRAGMGLCQERRCREQVAALLALSAGMPLDGVPLATYRAPVRPIPLGLAGTLPVSPEMAEHWNVWFGIPGQVVPYWEIKPLPLPLMPVGGADGNGLYGRQTLCGNLAYGGGPHEWLDDMAGIAAPPRSSTPLMGNIAAHLADLFPRARHARIIRSWAGVIEKPRTDGR